MKSREPAKLNRLGDMTIRNRVNAGELRRTKNGKLSPLYHDGGGLYLKVTGVGTASWVFRYKFNKRERELGLGAYPAISLAAARDKARGLRKLLAEGLDPAAHRVAAKRQAEVDKSSTFRHLAEQWLLAKKPGWDQATFIERTRTFETYAYPILGELPIRELDTTLILKVLEQPPRTNYGPKHRWMLRRSHQELPSALWQAFPTVTLHLRSGIEKIVDRAKARGLWDKDKINPAQWKGHLEHILPEFYSSQAKARHYRPLPYDDVPEFMAALQEWAEGPNSDQLQKIAASALRLQILTTTRPGEAVRARLDQVNLKTRIWTIPANAKKERRAHTVPLSDQAVEEFSKQLARPRLPMRLFTPMSQRIAEAMQAHPDFGGDRIARTVGCSTRTVRVVRDKLKSLPSGPREYIYEKEYNGKYTHLARSYYKNGLLIPLGYGHVDAHGFRSSFSTWVNEETEYPRELREFQLAHKVDDATAEAYQRGTSIKRRLAMIQHWADYCDGIIENKVIPFPQAIGFADE